MASSFTFDPSAGDVFVTLTQGSTLCLVPRGMATTRLGYAIQRCEATHVVTTPALWFSLNVDNDSAFAFPQSLQYIALGGESTPKELVREWSSSVTKRNGSYFPRLFNVRSSTSPSSRRTDIHEQICAGIGQVYGTTECTVYQTTFEHRVGVHVHRTNYIGRPLNGSLVRLLCQNDTKGHETRDVISSHGVVGEIVIGGRQVCRGYLHRPQLTSEKFVQHQFLGRLYLTGDLGRLDEGGLIVFLGRKDRQIKLNGRRVELGEIEHHIMSCSMVKHAAVICLSTAQQSSRADLTCVVEMKQRVSKTSAVHLLARVLRSWFRSRAPAYMEPHRLYVLGSRSSSSLPDTMPLTSSGKIDREAVKTMIKKSKSLVREKFSDEKNAHTSISSSRTMRVVSDVFKTVLGLDSIRSNEHFFDAGGDSLMALKVVQLLCRRYRQDVTLCKAKGSMSAMDEGTGVVTGVLSVRHLIDRPILSTYVAFLADLFEGRAQSQDDRKDETSMEIPSSRPRDFCPFEILKECSRLNMMASAQVMLKLVAPDGSVSREKPATTPLALAALNGHLDMCKLLRRANAKLTTVNVKGATPIHAAARGKCSSVLRWMLCEERAPMKVIDGNRQNLAHHAARAGHMDTLRVLVESTKDENTLFWLLNTTDRWGRTALIWATLNGHKDCVEFLCASGTVMNRDFSRRKLRKSTRLVSDGSPLHIASRHQAKDIARILLEFGANLDAKDDNQLRAGDAAAAAFGVTFVKEHWAVRAKEIGKCMR